MSRVLVTGGAGYIGSHTAAELVNKGFDVEIVDNLSNSSVQTMDCLQKVTGRKIVLHTFDLRDQSKLDKLFKQNRFDSVIHFAGLKVVGDSLAQPLDYYDNNLGSTLSLCQGMAKHGIRQLVFSSSANVYGNDGIPPIKETSPMNPTNPYGQTKAMIEQILGDLASSGNGWQITALRYFNPVGAHPSGLLGEDPSATPTNLLPLIVRVAQGKLEYLSVYGDDYNTPDGTGVRDYIHVVDLARGHIAALEHSPKPNQYAVYNLGTGHGHSVLETIKAFRGATGQKVAYKVVARRPNEIGASYADPSKANRDLEWKASLSLDQACADAWRWQQELLTNARSH